MSIGSVMSQNSLAANRRLPVGRSAAASGRNDAYCGTRMPSARYGVQCVSAWRMLL